jgi:PEP-CTERM motif
MTRHSLIALAGAVLLGAALPARADSPSLNPFHKAYASTRHCCWDNFFNYAWHQGDAPGYSAVSWSSRASGNGTLDYGLITADMSSSADVTNYVYVEAVGEGRDYWVDTFTITSDNLAAGTPVTLSLGVDLDANLASSGYGQGFALAVIGTGLDAGWLTGVDTRVVGAGRKQASGSFLSYVGGSVTLVGQLVSRAWSEASNGAGAGSASTQATARFTVESLTPGAAYRSASGHSYAVPASPVPEPSAVWLLLAGAGVAVAARTRRV